MFRPFALKFRYVIIKQTKNQNLKIAKFPNTAGGLKHKNKLFYGISLKLAFYFSIYYC